jgi:hypothetical protein
MITQTTYSNGVLVALTTVLILYGAYPIMCNEPQSIRIRLIFCISTFVSAIIAGGIFMWLTNGLPVSI